MKVLDVLSEASTSVLADHVSRAAVRLPTDLRLGTFFREIQGKAGESIPVGEVAERYFVVSGCLQLVSLVPEADFIHHFGVPTWWVADEKAFALRAKPEWGVTALQDSTVLAIDPQSQDELVSLWPGFATYLWWVYQRSFAALQRRVWYSQTLDARQRYELLVKTQPGFVQSVPQHRLAAYLGISPEHLSRIRRHRS